MAYVPFKNDIKYTITSTNVSSSCRSGYLFCPERTECIYTWLMKSLFPELLSCLDTETMLKDVSMVYLGLLSFLFSSNQRLGQMH